jgi:hypothetical protein
MQKGPVAVTNPKHSLEVRLDLLENLVAVFIGCEITFVEEQGCIALCRNTTPHPHTWGVLINLS